MRNSEYGKGRKPPLTLGVLLALLLVLTRFGHFGHSLVPGDASWAVFLLGGAFLRTSPALLGLCALAGAVDLASFALGVSTVCMSPGYVFLLPAYATLWWAGRFGGAGEVRQLPRVGVAAALGAVAAFTITNFGYFAFAPSLAGISPRAFVLAVSAYLPSYVIATLVYALTGHLLVHTAAALRHIGRSQHDDAG